VSVEMKTVNNRFLDVHLRMPSSLQAFESALKKQVSGSLTRGRVDVSIQMERTSEITYEVNKELIAGYLASFREIGEEFSLGGEADIATIAKLPGVLTAKEPAADGMLDQLLAEAVGSAIERLQEMRANEGASLYDELALRLDNIERHLDPIESESANVSEEYFKKLSKRIGELLEKAEARTEIDEGRLAQEVAYLADRSDISEEITRLRAHISHFRTIMDEESEVGKRLDFLTQELNREANTITSKTANLIVKENALAIKSEIEKIREQVQNIE
ncbi:MAG TPA: YicC family protein, partial [Blastocatellia bacterium]|nr:YicC family protein [Blastocatellia bacterium]